MRKQVSVWWLPVLAGALQPPEAVLMHNLGYRTAMIAATVASWLVFAAVIIVMIKQHQVLLDELENRDGRTRPGTREV